MHPAVSVIFFTTASGFGYGLLIWAGLLAPFGLMPSARWFGFAVMGAGLATVSAGLLSSMLHLGRPERAWRAFSQWRTSWLSREGVLAMVTFIPAVLFAFGWVILERTGGAWALCGLIGAALSLVTVGCTAMIYASLKPIRQWHHFTTLPAYIGFALMSGAAGLHAVIAVFGAAPKLAGMITGSAAVLLIPIVYTIKRAAWTAADTAVPTTTASTATGLRGAVRSVEWPHTEENYLLKEMGYRIARKHARRLRSMAIAMAFVIPELLLVLALGPPGPLSTAAAVAAALIMLAGIAVERWLFFAEAKHTVTLYYGR